MKYLFTGAFTFAIYFTSVAQSKFAVMAGYNHSSVRIHVLDKKQPTEYVPGFNAGLRFKTAFEPPLHFVGMLSYNLRGYIFKPLSGPVTRVETHMHYIDIAPMLNYDFKTGAKNHISLTVGPVMGIAITGRQKITENGTTTSSAMNFSVSKDYGLSSFAIHNGISYHFNNMFIEGAYNLGVSSINNNEETDDTNIKNRGFALSFGYWLK